MEKSSSGIFFDEMRLKRSLRPLRLLRLLRSLRPLRFIMPGNHSVCKVHVVVLDAKEAVEVIEASVLDRTTQSLKINKGAFSYEVRCFLCIFDLPTYTNEMLCYISLYSKIRCRLITYLPKNLTSYVNAH